jgi:hypothetical protein
MNRADAYSEDLLMRVVEGIATADEFAVFAEILRRDAALRRRYAREMRLHALLCCRNHGLLTCGATPCAVRVRRPRITLGKRYAQGNPRPPDADARRGLPVPRRTSRPQAGGRFTRIAAAAAALIGAGVVLWKTSDLRFPISDLRSLTSDLRSPASAPTVQLVRHAGMEGLVLPDALPGALRLAAGEAVVRLKSGVRLTLLGPAAVKVRDDMQVELEDGRLLADVPPVATGFIVRTDALELWDLGTVFGVSVSNGVSDVFVFKGEVQVNEASGEAVDLCAEGEGVRAAAGKTPVKVAADWSEARRLFAPVKGAAALAAPAAAFAAAGEIAALWEERYLPEEAWRVRERATRLAASLAAPARIPFSKSAWVRPAAPARQEETMKTTHVAAALAAAAVALGAETAGAVSEPALIDTSWGDRRWMTVHTNEVPLVWEWHEGAARAELEISGMNGSFATNFTETVTGCLWRAFGSSAPASEDVYDLTLTFRDGGGAVLGTLTSRLAVVAGAFGQTAVHTSPDNRRWERVKDNAVIPYDAGWAAATDGAASSRLAIAKEDGMTQANTLPGASGYTGWRLKGSDWGYGVFDLSLDFPGTEGVWDAALTRIPEGTMFSVR